MIVGVLSRGELLVGTIAVPMARDSVLIPTALSVSEYIDQASTKSFGSCNASSTFVDRD
jgi:hypothetical protein